MSTHTLPLTMSAADRAPGFVKLVALRAAGIVRAWRHRKDLSMLASLDDRMLADIGLTRGDLRDAAAALPWRDPTAVLVSRAGERRRARLHAIPGGRPLALDAPPTVPDIDTWSSGQFPARSRYY
jgi:uncharacterized protein YjiS (DUF1127 family)